MSKIVLDGHKLEWHGDRVRSWLKGGRVAPVEIEMALTRACTFKCTYCYAQLQTNDVKRMTWPVIKSFLEDAAQLGVKAVNLTGDGESTCSPSYYDTILYAKELGMDVSTGTNGYLLQEGRLLEVLPALTYVRFNISAGEKDRYLEIHGCKEEAYHRVMSTIRKCVEIKKANSLDTTIGLQMVLMPDFIDQVTPLVKLGRELGVDYLVIKHCSDDEFGSLGIDYSKYEKLTGLLKEAESYSTDSYKVAVKWSKILSPGKIYKRCYGPPFIMQISGSGLVAPCGMLFNNRYKEKFHIGNIAETRFRDIFNSYRYWEVMDYIGSEDFDVETQCGSLCLQHLCNEYLYKVKERGLELKTPEGELPQHVNFI